MGYIWDIYLGLNINLYNIFFIYNIYKIIFFILYLKYIFRVARVWWAPNARLVPTKRVFGYIRDIYGIYMGYIWDIYGIYMGYIFRVKYKSI